jgi:hypothetical protein
MDSRADSFPTSWFRSVGNILGIVGLLLLLIISSVRVDSPEEMSVHIVQTRVITAVLPLAAFLLLYSFGRFWPLSRRLPVALAVSSLVWIITWQIAFLGTRYQETMAKETLEPVLNFCQTKC